MPKTTPVIILNATGSDVAVHEVEARDGVRASQVISVAPNFEAIVAAFESTPRILPPGQYKIQIVAEEGVVPHSGAPNPMADRIVAAFAEHKARGVKVELLLTIWHDGPPPPTVAPEGSSLQ